ncbi:MAG TPA: hypothetical protein VM324_15575 [Egibacteraceae bacterium]|nr:hypothetical protein [Egibacteraceae bacterium]
MSALASSQARPDARRPRPAPPHAANPRLRVVERRRRPGRLVAGILAVAVLGIVGVVSVSALAAEAAFDARALQAEVADLSLRYEELTADVATLAAPERILRVAEEELGMVPASSPAFLVTDSGGPAASSTDLHDRIKPVLGE